MIIQNPLNKRTRLRVSKFSSDIIVENNNVKSFRNLEYKEQLTQNNWNLSNKTREDYYNDVYVDNPKIIGRRETLKITNKNG